MRLGVAALGSLLPVAVNDWNHGPRQCWQAATDLPASMLLVVLHEWASRYRKMRGLA